METTNDRRSRLVVLVSGSGSNLQALIDASADGHLDADIVAVISNRSDAYALERAASAGIETVALERADGEARADYDRRLADVVAASEPDWIVLAGWIRLLGMEFLGRFPDRVVNLHPALPGELPGIHAIERAWDQAMAGERTSSGVMVHLVPDEGVDDGPVLATARVAIDPNGSLDDFATAVHATEHRLLVSTMSDLCSHPRVPN